MSAMNDCWRALLLAASVLSTPAGASGAWPEVREVEVTMGLDWNSDRIFVDLPIYGTSGEILYRLVCRGGSETYLDTLSESTGINYVGPLMCILNEGSKESDLTLLSDDVPAWHSRGQFFREELVGACGDYPEFGRVRHFRLRGFTLTLEVLTPEVLNDRVAYSIFRISVRNDERSKTRRAEPPSLKDPRAPGGVCSVPAATIQ